MHLAGKVIVITGASRGLGKALAELCVHKGAHVVLSSNEKTELRAAARAAKGTAILADVRKEADMNRLARETVKKFGHIDVWINNAGIGGHHTAIEKQSAAFVREMMDVNFFGVFFGSRAALEVMKKQKSRGVIVNILSVRALTPHPLSSGYSASKAAAKGFTDALRAADSRKKISIIGVYPPGMRTDFFKKKPMGYHRYLDPHAVAEKIIRNLTRAHPKEEVVI